MNKYYEHLHNCAKEGLSDTEPRKFEQEGVVFGALLQVEVIRDAVKNLMAIKGAGFASDILICITAQARRVKLDPDSDITSDWVWFSDAAEDKELHAFIHAWLAPRRE